MKKTKELVTKIQQKNNLERKKIEKKEGRLRYKIGDPNRLNFYWGP